MARFEKSNDPLPDRVARTQVSSIEGVNGLSDGQRAVLCRLAENLIISEWIASPEVIQKMKSVPYFGLSKEINIGFGSLENAVMHYIDALRCVREALDLEIPPKIISDLLDRKILEQKQEQPYPLGGHAG